MRQDLTAPFIDKMEADRRSPIQLLVFHFEAGDVYLSDRALTLGGAEYLPIVEDWGELSTAGDIENDLVAETMQMTITLWNGGASPFSDRFLAEDPIDIHVELYQYFADLADSDKAIIDTFVVQDPIEYDEASRLLSLDLVSVNMRYDAPVGTVVDRDNWPFALEADLNKSIDLIVGSPGRVKTLCVRTALSATMKGSILMLPTIVNVHESLDDLGFPDVGELQIDDEIMAYSSRDEDTFTISERALYLTKAVEHSDGATVLEHITDHTYLIGQGPLASVSDVQAAGLPVDESEYTLDLDSDPATIIFPKKPFFGQYSKGARTTTADFDATNDDNGAWQPHYSYDFEAKSKGALVSANYTPLSIRQVDPAPDEGEVVRAFLSVEHWATKHYLNDQVIVWVEGIGNVGTLARPNPDDAIEFSAEVDIDHPHDHVEGGNHPHTFYNPGLNTSNPAHGHTLSGGGESDVDRYPTGISLGSYYSIAAGYSTYIYLGLSFSSGFIYKSCTFTRYNDSSAVNTRAWIQWGNGNYNNSVEIGTGTFSVGMGSNAFDRVRIRIKGEDNSHLGKTKFTALKFTFSYSSQVIAKATAVSASHSSTGNVVNQNLDTTGAQIKDPDDVNDLATANRQLEQVVSNSSSRSVAQKFDLTKYLETISWPWFQERKVQLIYSGFVDDVQIVVTYINFEIEYRQRETVLTDDISCVPVGTINNRPDAVVQYLLTTKAGLDVEKLGSVWKPVNALHDADSYADTEVWLDGGAALNPPIGAAFEDAGARFAYLGYLLDGVISGTNSVREAIKQVCYQSRSRLIWSGGKAKLAVRERQENWTPVVSVLPERLQLKSISVRRKSATEIINSIKLFYGIDRLSEADGEGSFLAAVYVDDKTSIAKHGERADNSRFQFDLVRDGSMAENLAGFYLWLLGESTTFYDFVVYLHQFGLEKEDVLLLTSATMTDISLRPLVVRAVNRLFGSGKLERINTLPVTAEAIRQKNMVLMLEDSVQALDSIDLSVASELDLSDLVVAIDDLVAGWPKGVIDQVVVEDEIDVILSAGELVNDTVSVQEELAMDLAVALTDDVMVHDAASILHSRGYGSGGYGDIPYGSRVTFEPAMEDIALVSDDDISVVTAYHLELEDDVLIEDGLLSSEALFDTVIADDSDIILSGGYGGSLGAGYGNAPYGR